jgi:hypothetical protein
MALAVEQQDRRRTGDRFHQLAWVADVVLRGLPLEELLDQVPIGDVEELTSDGIPRAKDAPVSVTQGVPCLDGPQDAEQGLQEARDSRPRNLGGGPEG